MSCECRDDPITCPIFPRVHTTRFQLLYYQNQYCDGCTKNPTHFPNTRFGRRRGAGGRCPRWAGQMVRASGVHTDLVALSIRVCRGALVGGSEGVCTGGSGGETLHGVAAERARTRAAQPARRSHSAPTSRAARLGGGGRRHRVGRSAAEPTEPNSAWGYRGLGDRVASSGSGWRRSYLGHGGGRQRTLEARLDRNGVEGL